MNGIECKNLSKSYGKIQAIEGLSVQIQENKITGLIGRNGAGKTTLLKMIAGYLKPTQGELQVLSHTPFNSLAVSAQTIFIDDNMTFPDSFTLDDILTEVAPFYPNWDSHLAKGLFDYFSLNPKQRHSRLSKGTKSIFNSIIGLASHCPLTLFDEPTTGMDSAVRKDFYRALLKDYIEYPRTVILSSHLLGELEDLLEDILLLDQGNVRLHLPVVELKEYAIGIRGKAETVRQTIGGREILYQEEFAKDSLYVVVKRNSLQGNDQDYQKAQANGIELLPVSINDLCIYMTEKTKGGIDDVFKRG